MTLDEAIAHCKEKAEELRTDAEQLRDIGEVMSSPKQPYNEPVKNCLECASEHEQLAEWLEELVERREAHRWISVSERLPDEKINPNTNDFEKVLCSTIWGDVRPYKYGKPKGHDKAHFWLGGGIMDEYVIAWKPLPKPYELQEARKE